MSTERRPTYRARIGSLAVAVLAVTGLVLGSDYATYASTGDSMVLGQLNKANVTTTIKNTGATPALRLVTDDTEPPLEVTSNRRVAKLNADQVDGLNGADLANDTYVFTDNRLQVDFGKMESYVFPTVPKGTYFLSISASIGVSVAPNVAACDVFANGELFAENSAPYGVSLIALVSGSEVITVDDPADLHLRCVVDTGSFFYVYPLRVSLTKTNVVQTGTLQSLG